MVRDSRQRSSSLFLTTHITGTTVERGAQPLQPIEWRDDQVGHQKDEAAHFHRQANDRQRISLQRRRKFLGICLSIARHLLFSFFRSVIHVRGGEVSVHGEGMISVSGLPDGQKSQYLAIDDGYFPMLPTYLLVQLGKFFFFFGFL